MPQVYATIAGMTIFVAIARRIGIQVRVRHSDAITSEAPPAGKSTHPSVFALGKGIPALRMS